MARIEDSKKAQEVLLFIETARINVKKITEEALVKPTSKETIKSKIEAQIKACSEFLKAQGPIYQELAKSAYNGLKKLSNECLKQIDAFFAANQSNDLVKALALAYKKQETDSTKKTSKTFVIGDGELNLEEDMSVKFKETSGEYGYDQMIIDDYQERVKEAIKNISNLTLTEKTYREVNGRKVGAPVFLSIRNKAEMTVRYEAMKEELQELCDSGEQYVIVSQHKDASKRCSPLQGLLYKLDVDPTQDVKCVLSSKELGTRSPKQIGTVDGNPYYSLKEAMSYGLFSYNCRHRFIKYIPGSKVTPQYKYDEKAAEQKREIDKNMREMERQIRALKERQVLALDSKERKFYQDASKQAQAKYKAYATKHGRDINLWRCRITKAERQHNKEIYKENGNTPINPLNNPSISQNDVRTRILERNYELENKIIDVVGKENKIPQIMKDKFNIDEGKMIVFRDADIYRQGSAEHIVKDHCSQVDKDFIDKIKQTIASPDEVGFYDEVYGRKRFYFEKFDHIKKGKIKNFYVFVDENEDGNYEIVTAFVRPKIKNN